MMRGQPSMSADLLKHLQEAGIRPDHPIVSYLTHIGLISDIAFVEFKPDTVELAGWCDKLKSEVTFGDNKIGPIDGDQLDVMKASLIATHKSITKKLGSSMPAIPPPTGPTVPSVITLKDSEDKAPKALPPGIYADLVEAYNRVTINGQRRTFPEKLLLGAEKIIARMWHEHVKTKCYTGVKLGELLQHRHFTATGSVNNRVTDKTNETVLTIDADTKTLIEKNKQEWNDFRWPRSHQMGMDTHSLRGWSRHQQLYPTIWDPDQETQRSPPTNQDSLEHILLADCYADERRGDFQTSQPRCDPRHSPTDRYPDTTIPQETTSRVQSIQRWKRQRKEETILASKPFQPTIPTTTIQQPSTIPVPTTTKQPSDTTGAAVATTDTMEPPATTSTMEPAGSTSQPTVDTSPQSTGPAESKDDLIILITSGPPCVDFSRLRNLPPGMQGEQGNLLSRQTEIILGIQEDWSHLYLVLYLLENVVPQWSVPGHHFKTRHNTNGDRRQGWRHHLQTTTLVVWHWLGYSNQTTTFQHSMADHTNIPPDDVALDQPHCHPAPTRHSGPRLGNTNSPPAEPTVPLPNHPSQLQRWQTTATISQRGWRHLETLGGQQQTIPTMAVPTRIPHQIQRQPVAPRCKGNAWWGSRTITPTHLQQMTEPETACLATPGMSLQQYGYYSSFYFPPTHKPYQCQSSIPTSRRWQPFGRQPQHRGVQPITPYRNTTCHSSTGHNTSTGPVHTTNEDTSPGLLIRPYIGQYNNNYTSLTSNKSDKTSSMSSRHWRQNGMMPQSNGSRHYQITASQRTNNHTWSHRYQYYTIYSPSYDTLMQTYCCRNWPQASHL